MPKPVRELIQQLPNYLEEKVIRNIEADKRINIRKAKARHLTEVLAGAFSWTNSPEGHNYWQEVFIKAKLNKY